MTDTRALVRKSLPLTAADLRDLALVRSSPEYRHAPHEITGSTLTADTSEATYLHALLQAGIKALQEQAEDRGYAAMADHPDETAARRHRAARRRTPTWAGE